ncbi:MAG TPA: calcium/sodium antiporter [Spirochaetota bacterium]|nr:calcium/sodium antiporter [Spirochaetota bacterium]HPY03450.1 calcium/sodium antiporter [Spirochaetota bacterium]HQA53203.1 calcium/sodium antiporter [Spirochaetota bacterium]
MLINILFLVAGISVIIYAANLLVDGSASIAKKLKVSDIVIGLTIVAFGTSAPELTVGIFSAAKGNTDLALGNVIGSNIANIFLILGASAFIFPLAIKKNTQWKEIPYLFFSSLLVVLFANDVILGNSFENTLSRTEGIVFLIFFIIFLFYTFRIAKEQPSEDVHSKIYSLPKSIIFIILGLCGLVGGGKILIDGAVGIATIAGISERIIGVTIVAVGTSLPELATSIVAAFKKKSDIAIGNVVGSNIFNIFLILGSAIIVRPAPVSLGSNIDMLIALFAGLILFISTFTLKHRTIGRIEGGVFLIFYASYIFYLIKIQL